MAYQYSQNNIEEREGAFYYVSSHELNAARVAMQNTVKEAHSSLRFDLFTNDMRMSWATS